LICLDAPIIPSTNKAIFANDLVNPDENHHAIGACGCRRGGGLVLRCPASQAYGDAPWCAVVSVGQGDVVWDCQYRSVEDCRPNVIAGNRGFCNMNPAWQRWYAPKTVTPRKHRTRHVIKP
jgi:hypothetical protein